MSVDKRIRHGGHCWLPYSRKPSRVCTAKVVFGCKEALLFANRKHWAAKIGKIKEPKQLKNKKRAIGYLFFYVHFSFVQEHLS